MNRSLFSILSLCMFLLAFSACESGSAEAAGPTAEEMMVKTWKLSKLNVKDQMTSPAIMVSSSFSFHKDGKYEIVMGEAEKGTWTLSADKRILITRPTTGGENQIDIERLEPDFLVLTNNAGPNPVRMELVPL